MLALVLAIDGLEFLLIEFFHLKLKDLHVRVLSKEIFRLQSGPEGVLTLYRKQSQHHHRSQRVDHRAMLSQLEVPASEEVDHLA